MRILWSALIALALIIGGYIFFWNKAADTFLEMAELQKQDLVSDGYEVTHGELTVEGFPYRLRLNVPELKVRRKYEDLDQWGEFSAPLVWIVAEPWRPSKVIFGTEGTYREALFDERNGEKTLVTEFLSEEFIGSATLTETGQFERFAMDLKQNTTNISFGGGGSLKTKRIQMHMRPTVETETEPAHQDTEEKTSFVPGTEVSLRMDDTLIQSDNAAMKEINVPKAAILMSWSGPADVIYDPKKVKEWAQSGNALEIKSLLIDWTDGRIEGDGTFTLDQEYRLLGAASLKAWGVDKLNPMMFTSLAMIMPPAKDEAGEVFLSGAFTFQDGWLSIGGERVAPLEPLFDD
ncbi:MAG: DUF2125 domain-containing protein [Sneathiella sp.]|nr:DUF2125 domain-containing protein [Sneathiella sp.]